MRAPADLIEPRLLTGRILQSATSQMRVADRDDFVAVVCRARNKLVPAFSHSFYILSVVNVVLGVGEKLFGFREFSSLTGF